MPYRGGCRRERLGRVLKYLVGKGKKAGCFLWETWRNSFFVGRELYGWGHLGRGRGGSCKEESVARTVSGKDQGRMAIDVSFGVKGWVGESPTRPWGGGHRGLGGLREKSVRKTY